jgi:hypothetical protein
LITGVAGFQREWATPALALKLKKCTGEGGGRRGDKFKSFKFSPFKGAYDH